MEFQRKWRKIDREFQRAAYNSKIQLTVSPGWEKHSPGTTLVAVGSGRRSGGAGERARAEGAWLRRPLFIAG